MIIPRGAARRAEPIAALARPYRLLDHPGLVAWRG
jgi:hypothetical protein